MGEEEKVTPVWQVWVWGEAGSTTLKVEAFSPDGAALAWYKKALDGLFGDLTHEEPVEVQVTRVGAGEPPLAYRLITEVRHVAVPITDEESVERRQKKMAARP